jgi:O-antigen/teichoic acid export membrane protein
MSKDRNRTRAKDTGGLSLGKSSLIGFGGKMSLAVIGFIGLVFFYRTLGPVGIGIYYTIISVGKLINSLQSGIQSAIKKRVSEVDADQSEFLGLGVVILISVTIIGAVIISVGATIGPELIQFADRFGLEVAAERIIGAPKYLFAALGVAISLSAFGLSNQFYAGIGNPGKSIWVDALRSLLTLGGQAALIIVGFDEFGLVWGFVIGTVVTTVVVTAPLGIKPTIPSRTVIKRTASFAKWTIPLGLFSNIYRRLDVIFLTAVLGASVSGVYAPALRMTAPAAFVASSISSSLIVKSSGLDSQNKSVQKHVRNGISYAGLIAIPTFFGALAMPEALMGVVFGPTARAGAGALIGLAIYQIFRSYIYPLGSVIKGTDRPDLLVKIMILTLIINIPLAIVLVQLYGLLGVVAATVIAEGSRLGMSYIAVVHIQGSPGIPQEVFKQLFAAVVMFGVIKGVSSGGILVPETELTLAVTISLGGTVYFAILSVVSRRFRNTLWNVAGETIPV